MVKYHINKETGRPNICRANIKWPLTTDDGKPVPHFSNKNDARDYYEKINKNNNIPIKMKKSHNNNTVNLSDREREHLQNSFNRKVKMRHISNDTEKKKLYSDMENTYKLFHNFSSKSGKSVNFLSEGDSGISGNDNGFISTDFNNNFKIHGYTAKSGSSIVILSDKNNSGLGTTFKFKKEDDENDIEYFQRVEKDINVFLARL